MQITKHIHAVKIPFQVPISPEKAVDRFVYSYIVFAEQITLIDTGVKGSERVIFDYVAANGRDPKEISAVILSHSHPDHIGAALAIVEATGCRVLAHPGEKDWIEDTEKQFRERPVPGFRALVGGSVKIDQLIEDGQIVTLGKDVRGKVIHTPGHSRGSVSLLFAGEGALFTGDGVPVPNDMPIYDDIAQYAASLRLLKQLEGAGILLQSWEAPVQGEAPIAQRIDASISWLRRIHEAAGKAVSSGEKDPIELCRIVVSDLGLPPFAINPIVAGSIASSLAVLDRESLFQG